MFSLEQINLCDRITFVAILGPVFERSPWVAEDTFEKRPFKSRAHLHAAMCASVRGAPLERQLELIRSHPDLAGRLARMGLLTPASAREQASSELDRLEEDEMAELQTLNAAYWARFGCPFVICTRLYGKEAIFRSIRSRLRNTPEAEEAVAIGEIERIAEFRLADQIAE